MRYQMRGRCQKKADYMRLLAGGRKIAWPPKHASSVIERSPKAPNTSIGAPRGATGATAPIRPTYITVMVPRGLNVTIVNNDPMVQVRVI